MSPQDSLIANKIVDGNHEEMPMTETRAWKWMAEHKESNAIEAKRRYLASEGFIIGHHQLPARTIDNITIIFSQYWREKLTPKKR